MKFYLNSIIKIMLLINRTDELKPITEPYRHLPGKSAHLQTVTGHFSNTDLRDVVATWKLLKLTKYEIYFTL
jgi:hypothetical protein